MWALGRRAHNVVEAEDSAGFGDRRSCCELRGRGYHRRRRARALHAQASREASSVWEGMCRDVRVLGGLADSTRRRWWRTEQSFGRARCSARTHTRIGFALCRRDRAAARDAIVQCCGKMHPTPAMARHTAPELASVGRVGPNFGRIRPDYAELIHFLPDMTKFRSRSDWHAPSSSISGQPSPGGLPAHKRSQPASIARVCAVTHHDANYSHFRNDVHYVFYGVGQIDHCWPNRLDFDQSRLKFWRGGRNRLISARSGRIWVNIGLLPAAGQNANLTA